MTMKTNEMRLGELVERYTASSDFTSLQPATQRAYLIYLKRLSPLGNKIVSKLIRSDIYDIYDKYNGLPGAQRTLIKVTRRMFGWGLSRELIASAPMVQQGRASTSRRQPHMPWSDAHIRNFRTAAAEYASGRPDRQFVPDALEIALATGQRIDDVCNNMKMSGYDGEYFEVTQGKTGNLVRFKPSGRFKEILDGRIGERYVLCMPPPFHGRVQRLRYHFDAVREMAKVEPTFHGLRKTVAIKLTEAGMSEAQIAALLGHKTRRMVQEYAAMAQRTLLATQAADKMSVLDFN